ncbi:MAG TPA: hypothetical protein PLX89_08175 [Verrucomicrobiota bacterium]|nr:hypothetical protein [Verrucomicrobiota bacterium]
MKQIVGIIALTWSMCQTRASDDPTAGWIIPTFLARHESSLDRSLTPSVEIATAGGTIQIAFGGTLESAPGLDGPWNPEPEVTNPYRPDPASANQRFFRARSSDSESIFSSRSVVNWNVTGPWQTHFDLAFAGTPDGIFPPRREKPYFDGSLTMNGTTISVSWRVRGNSSLQECPFPKLKLKISREAREGTPFFDAREIKVGTHCAEGGRGTIGRLRDERATYREALAYEAMESFGFLTPRVRRARIEFRDTSPMTSPNPGGWVITRNAVILDDPEVIGERLGGRALTDDEIAALQEANFGEQLITELKFFHILLGNWDYTLSLDGRGLWNTDVVQLADGKYVPVAGDFDLSSWVTEKVLSNAPRDYHPELPELDRRARFELSEVRRNVTEKVFNSARGRFEPQRSTIEELVKNAVVDEVGRTNALQHVSAFFGALSKGGE